MAELSIEEKAKAYDYAINKAKELILNENGVVRVDKPLFDELFPSEMEESEDEKIRNWLIGYFHQYKEDGVEKYANGLKVESIIAWLEKQGEPKEINPSEFDSQLNRLLGQFKPLPKEELASSLSFYLNVVQNDGTYKEEKQGEQKPTWSEEDDFMYNKIKNLLTDISLAPESIKSLFDWLKSVKSRVQPKQEWSGKDERYVKDLADYFTGGHPLKYAEEDIADWFKSLKDRYAWKPSEEMLEALDIAIRAGIQLDSWEEKALRELQKQLKEL